MPNIPSHPCYHAGCKALVASGPYCAKHATRQRKQVTARQRVTRAARIEESPALALAARIRSSSEWQKARAAYIAQHPVCCDPFDSHGQHRPALAFEVHHIKGLVERPDLATNKSNLAALCIPCHRKVEGMVRRGRPTAYLFRFLLSPYPQDAYTSSDMAARLAEFGILTNPPYPIDANARAAGDGGTH